jgi:hypothetical protein
MLFRPGTLSRLQGEDPHHGPEGQLCVQEVWQNPRHLQLQVQVQQFHFIKLEFKL